MSSLVGFTRMQVRGEALSSITARATWTFEIRYRDRSGDVAPATDLDVFVEPDASAALLQQHDAMVTGNGATCDTMGSAEAGKSERAAASAAATPRHLEHAPADEEPLHTRARANRVVVGRHPLIVRVSADLDSEQVHLIHHAMVVLIVVKRVHKCLAGCPAVRA